jgi:glyoxylase-like metal-dependent hydrolase (beta-lactamase superfamily II)
MKAINFKILANHLNQEEVLYLTVIQDGPEVLLIDCGYEGCLPAIEKELVRNNLQIKDLTGVIISHDDIDHVGGLYEIKAANPAIKVYSSKLEAPYLNGLVKSIRLQQVEDSLPAIPKDYIEWALAFQKELQVMKRVAVDQSFDFDEHYSENLKIINTPGHTPGHISIYLPSEKILIANDALIVENGKLEIANPSFTLDLEQAIESVKKISHLEINELWCYHGGVVVGDIPEKITKLIDTSS